MTENNQGDGLMFDVNTPLLGQYRKEKSSINRKNVFRISKEDLTLFFEKRNIKIPDNKGECRVSLNILRDCGYIQGLCRLLNSDPVNGIVGDKQDILRRQKVFGKHSIALPEISKFWTLLSRNFEDNNVILLTWASTIYLILSLFGNGGIGYIESLTIYAGLFFSALISSTCDYIKESQFLLLKDEINNQQVTVYRGAYGTSTSILVRDLVVGDIVDVNQGNRIPADCILIDEIGLKVDQSMYFPKETRVEKEESQQRNGNPEFDNHKEHPDPFLFVDSKVMAGQGKAIVCAVGENTMLARHRKQGELKLEEQNTFLEEKLEKLSNKIGKYAIFATIVCFLTQILFTIALSFFGLDDNGLFSNKTLLKLSQSAIFSVVLMMVAIPEGLPLAVSIAMALSVKSLKKDEILIKNLEAIQTCATLHDICVGKTGTLTKGQMQVRKYHLCDQVTSTESEENQFQLSRIQSELKQLIKEAILANSNVRIEIEEDKIYVPKGEALEVGMIKFLFENGEDVPALLISRNKFTPIDAQIPFEQNLKREIVVRPIDKKNVRIYIKGAPEYIIPMCTQTLGNNFRPQNFSETEQQNILKKVVSGEMASQGLKVLTYAFKQVSKDELQSWLQNYDQESEEFREIIEQDLIYIATFGLEDPIRAGVEIPIQLIRFGHSDQKVDLQNQVGQVQVRIISGDHVDTCRYVAEKCGIITPNDPVNRVMTGEQFRDAIGQYNRIFDNNTQQFTIEFKDPKLFEEIKKRVRVIARCTPEDKFILVAGIQKLGGLVAMAGDSISDAEALKKANVGLCMGSGCDVAKDNSDLVILDDDFRSIHTAIKWGRAIFDNVRKFLQFQMTINISIIIITIIGGLCLGHTPLNVIQMLWINLIMDSLGAIAIGTEPYKKDQTAVSIENKQTRISRRDKIFLQEMWRQIIVQAVFQILVMLTLMFFGGLIFFEQVPNLIYTPLRDSQTKKATTRLILDTICFHTFVLMNIFNMINCRVVDKDEMNVFKTLFNNYIFWIILAIEILIQQFMINQGSVNLTIGSALLGTGPLSFWQQVTCWVLGSLSLAVNAALKKIPLETFNFTQIIDLESEQENDKLKAISNLSQKISDTKNYMKKLNNQEE